MYLWDCPVGAREKHVLRKSLFFLDQLCLIVLFIPLSVFWGIGCYFASLFPGGENRAHRYLVRWARFSLRLARLHVTVAGLERLDLDRTYVFMPNHSSFLDILLVFAFIPYNFRFIVKKEFFSIPLLGLTVKSSAQIPLDRKHPRKGLQSIKQAADLLKKGVSIVVFPEGTRTRDGQINEFKTTLFVLPIRTRTPVAPVLIEGAFEALQSGSVLLKRCPVKITFLDPVPADFLADKDRALYAERVRQSLIGASQNQCRRQKQKSSARQH
jgi:1-acyl-sn-glycerol-3-phosphate acyltransferase